MGGLKLMEVDIEHDGIIFLLRGKPDLLKMEPPIIIDIKHPTPVKVKRYIDRISLQLNIYGWMFKTLNGTEPELFYFDGKLREIEKDLEDAYSKVISYIKSVKTLMF